VALGPAAAALKAGLRSGDVLGHLGQGRFVVCLPDATPQAAARVCERLAGGLVARVELEVVDGLAGTPEEQLALALREKAGLRK
jgi:GGDEF domain-containing protein